MKSRPLMIAVGLLLAVGVGWLVLKNPSASPPGSSGPGPVALDVEIKSVAVQKTGDHGQLILTASFQQSGQTPIRLEPPLVELHTTNGKTAPRYLGPFLPEPVLSGAGPAVVILHYWLPLSDLSGPLTLEASGQQYPLVLPTP